MAEAVDDGVAGGALERARQRGDCVALGVHAALDLGGGVAALDEDDGGADGHEPVQLY